MFGKKRWFRIGVVLGVSAAVLAAPAAIAARPGALDKSFSGDGIRIEAFAPNYEEASDVLTLPNGKIVTAGWVDDSSNSRQGLYLARYRANGSLDKRFGNNGRRFLNLNTYTYTKSLVRQPNGKLIVLAAAGLSDTAVTVARFMPDGKLDKTFSGNGYDQWDMGSADNFPEDAVVLPDGDIMIAGWGSGPQGFLARYDSNGSLDSGFDGDGFLPFPSGTPIQLLRSMVVQRNKILLGGRYDEMAAVMRVNAAGQLDASFGAGGFRHIPGGGTETSALALDGKKIVATSKPDTGTSVARLTAGGDLDTTFSNDGVFSPGDLSVSANAVSLQPRHRPVVVGETVGDERWVAFRLTKKGKLDRTFGNKGISRLDLKGDLDRPRDIATQRDGKAISVGYSGKGGGGSDYHSTLVRYKGDVWTHALKIRTKFGQLVVSGWQFPARPGYEMTVTLLERKGGKYVRLDQASPALGRARDPNGDGWTESRFGTRLQSSVQSRCKVIARFPGDAVYQTSKATKTFAC